MDLLCFIWNEVLGIAEISPPRSQVSRFLLLHTIGLFRTAKVLVKDEVAKVADFGVSRFIEEGTVVHALPWRWTAPEVKEARNTAGGARDGVTTKSDVFSFGGLIYEALRLGERPFMKRASTTEKSGEVSKNWVITVIA